MNIICVFIGMAAYFTFAWMDRKDMIKGILKNTLTKFANLKVCDICCRKGIGQWLRENDDGIKWEKNPIARNREKVLELRKCNTLEMTINEDDLRKTEVRVEADEIGKLREELERKDRVIREKSKLVQKNYVVIAEKDKLIASKNETIQKLKAMLK